MSGIKGQPSAKPSDVKSPIPGQTQTSAFDSADTGMGQAAGKAASAFDTADTGISQNAQQPQSQFPGAGLVQGTLDALPTIAGVAGGLLSAGAGPEAIPLGAYAGGVAGQSLKTYLQSVIFGQQPASRSEFYNKLATSGEDQAKGMMLGTSIFGAPAEASFAKSGMQDVAASTDVGNVGGIIKPAVELTQKAVLEGASRTTEVPEDVIKNYFNAPQPVKDLAVKFSGDVPEAANAMRQEFNTNIQQTRDQMEGPAREAIAGRITAASPMEAGDNVKSLLSQTLTQQNSEFVQAHQFFDTVNSSLPLDINARLKFGNSLTNDAKSGDYGHIKEYYGAAEKYRDLFGASETGAGFKNSMKVLDAEITTEFRAGDNAKAKFLVDIKDKATDFLDKQIDKLADTVQNGKPSPEQTQAMQAIRDSQGMQGLSLKRYADDMAQAYTNNKSAVNRDYAVFKGFQSDVGEQTRTSSRGAVSQVAAINDVPSEKLIERMLDPKNAAALSRMKTATPQVFQEVANFKVKQIADASTVDGVLDLSKFADNVMNNKKLPPDVRNLVFTPEELKGLNSVVKDPKYQRFNNLVEATKPMLTDLSDPASLIKAGTAGTNDARNLGELSLLTGKNMIGPAQSLAAMNAFGKKNISLTSSMLKKGMDLTKPIIEFGQSAAKAAPNAIPGYGGQ